MQDLQRSNSAEQYSTNQIQGFQRSISAKQHSSYQMQGCQSSNSGEQHSTTQMQDFQRSAKTSPAEGFLAQAWPRTSWPLQPELTQTISQTAAGTFSRTSINNRELRTI